MRIDDIEKMIKELNSKINAITEAQDLLITDNIKWVIQSPTVSLIIMAGVKYNEQILDTLFKAIYHLNLAKQLTVEIETFGTGFLGDEKKKKEKEKTDEVSN